MPSGASPIFAAVKVRAAVAILMGAAVCWLAGHFARASGTSFNYEVAAAVATAYGTLALALVTAGLVAATRQDVAGTRKLAQLTEREQAGQLRPCVYPLGPPALKITIRAMGDPGIVEEIPLQNGGPGVALNVTGQVYWASSDAALVSTTLASGDRAFLPPRTEVPAGEAWGLITYRDILGRAWETRFVIEMGADGNLRPEIRAYGYADRLPQYAYPKGWELNGGAPWLAIDQPE